MDDITIEIGVKHLWRNYKPCEIVGIEMLTRTQFDEFFISKHNPKTPIGQAVESHIAAYQKAIQDERIKQEAE